jgi:hypothetical protein
MSQFTVHYCEGPEVEFAYRDLLESCFPAVNFSVDDGVNYPIFFYFEQVTEGIYTAGFFDGTNKTKSLAESANELFQLFPEISLSRARLIIKLIPFYEFGKTHHV